MTKYLQSSLLAQKVGQGGSKVKSDVVSPSDSPNCSSASQVIVGGKDYWDTLAGWLMLKYYDH